MLIYRIFASLVRCAISIRKCAYNIVIDITSTFYSYIEDKKLGDIDTSCSLRDPKTKGTYDDASGYQPTGYLTVYKMVEYLNLNKDDVLVDYGCGKGRVVFVVATQRIRKVIGIELDKNLADIAELNFGKLKQNNTPIEILNMDAISFDPEEGTVFFMFNAFGYRTMNVILKRIKDSLIINSRNIRIVYFAPFWGVLLDTMDWLEEEKRNEDLPFRVWHNKKY